VYLLRHDLAIVQTVDFFTPIVDDPSGFGMIAASNAFSDIYARGAVPLTALNIVAFPQNGPPGLDVLDKILEGGFKKAAEANVSIIGGHTIDDREPKYGLAVTGLAHPDELFSHSGARSGDFIVLTKPLGTGILATGIKQGRAGDETEKILIETCSFLNDRACSMAHRAQAKAVTDVTGFGLLLHLLNILEESNAGCELWMDQIPVLPDVYNFMEKGLVPGGTRRNMKFALTHDVKINADVDENQILLINDAQTSGGLLICINPEKAGDAMKELKNAGITSAAIIGRITDHASHIEVKSEL
jgi:selenide,water dikinase